MSTGDGEQKPLRVEVSTGVVFELTAPTVWAINDLQRELRESMPKPPMVYIKDIEREEENPADPDYLKAKEAYDLGLVQRMYDICISTGTRVVECPIGNQDSGEFEEILGVFGFEIATSKLARYLQWVKYMAAPTPEDMEVLLSPLLRMLGTTEEDVAEATATFRGPEERPAHNGSRVERPRRNRADVRPTRS